MHEGHTLFVKTKSKGLVLVAELHRIKLCSAPPGINKPRQSVSKFRLLPATGGLFVSDSFRAVASIDLWQVIEFLLRYGKMISLRSFYILADI